MSRDTRAMPELSFDELQNRLCELAAALTVRSLEPDERTIVVVHSLSLEIPDHLAPVLPAYEERFLCLVLILLRQPRTHVVYVTSQPILPRLIDYWLRLVPRVDADDAEHIGWDDERQTGVALHMVSAIAVSRANRADGNRRLDRQGRDALRAGEERLRRGNARGRDRLR